jgi:hypothetical protein
MPTRRSKTLNPALNPALSKQILGYAAMAAAGATAAATPANAEVVYTPAHQTFQFRYKLDLNNDGITDFKLSSSYLSGFGRVAVTPIIFGNRVVGTPQSCDLGRSAEGAAALRSGAVIGQGAPFLKHEKCLASLDSFASYGPWLQGETRYLGLAFEVNGTNHFGWARIRRNSFFCEGCVAAILDYAYETIPGKPIIAGDEGKASNAPASGASLGALAAGARSLNVRRKEDYQ